MKGSMLTYFIAQCVEVEVGGVVITGCGGQLSSVGRLVYAQFVVGVPDTVVVRKGAIMPAPVEK